MKGRDLPAQGAKKKLYTRSHGVHTGNTAVCPVCYAFQYGPALDIGGILRGNTIELGVCYLKSKTNGLENRAEIERADAREVSVSKVV